MASRAHVIHDYSFGGSRSLRRRQAWYLRDEPITLPKSSFWVAGFGALATAAATAAIVAAGAYAVTQAAPAQLTETPALEMSGTWQPDLALVNQAGLVKLLQGPALSAPDKATPTLESSSELAEATTSPDTREVIIDDSKLYPIDESKLYPRTAAPEQAPVPYPNPITTPPDAIAPPAPQTTTTPTEPAPSTDPENPYRDGL